MKSCHADFAEIDILDLGSFAPQKNSFTLESNDMCEEKQSVNMQAQLLVREEEKEEEFEMNSSNSDQEEVKAPSQPTPAAPVQAAPTPTPVQSAPPKQVVPIPSGKPSFYNVISVQHNTGYWDADKAPYLAGCFKDGQTEDASVRQALNALTESLTADTDKEILYVTLLAIFVLTEVFAEFEDQWTLLVRKAKTYLKKAGVIKPEKLVHLFNL